MIKVQLSESDRPRCGVQAKRCAVSYYVMGEENSRGPGLPHPPPSLDLSPSCTLLPHRYSGQPCLGGIGVAAPIDIADHINDSISKARLTMLYAARLNHRNCCAPSSADIHIAPAPHNVRTI